MAKRLRLPLSYANVMASVAVFLSLAGGAYALAIPDNSVGGKQLKRNAVTSSKVRDGSLRVKDFGPGQLPAGRKGETGPAGPKGDVGPRGPAGLSGLELVTVSTVVNSSDSKTANAFCPDGKLAVATGAEVFSAGSTPMPREVGVQASSFGHGRLSVYGLAKEHVATNADWGLVVQALCADATG